MILYRIPITDVKQSTNKIYAGIHWTKRKKIKDGILDYANIFCRPIKQIKSYPVEISYKFIFESRALDTLNCAYMAKMFEDALRSLEILEDDDPKHVTRTIIEVVMVSKSKNKKILNDMGKKKVEKNNDWLEISIQQIK